jgi:hypothetical protein
LTGRLQKVEIALNGKKGVEVEEITDFSRTSGKKVYNV